MAVTIRFLRQGAKKNPQYMIVAVDSPKKRDGEYLEKLGYYYPKAEKTSDKLKVNAESLNVWLKKGAQMSQSARQVLKSIAKS